MNNTGVTGQILPPNTDFEHARVRPTQFAYTFWTTTDTHIYIAIKKKAFKINAKIEDVGLNED